MSSSLKAPTVPAAHKKALCWRTGSPFLFPLLPWDFWVPFSQGERQASFLAKIRGSLGAHRHLSPHFEAFLSFISTGTLLLCYGWRYGNSVWLWNCLGTPAPQASLVTGEDASLGLLGPKPVL